MLTAKQKPATWLQTVGLLMILAVIAGAGNAQAQQLPLDPAPSNEDQESASEPLLRSLSGFEFTELRRDIDPPNYFDQRSTDDAHQFRSPTSHVMGYAPACKFHRRLYFQEWMLEDYGCGRRRQTIVSAGKFYGRAILFPFTMALDRGRFDGARTVYDAVQLFQSN